MKSFFDKIAQRSISIKNKISLSFSFTITFLLIIILVVVYQISSQILIEKTIENSLQNMRLISESIDSMLLEVESSTNAIVTNKTVQDIMVDNERNGHKSYSDQMKMTGTLDTLLTSRELIESMFIYSLDGHAYDSGKMQKITPLEWEPYRSLQNNIMREKKRWVETHQSNYCIREHPTNILSFVKVFYGVTTGKELGVAVSNINEETIAKVYEKVPLGDTGIIFIVDHQGNIISAKNKELLYTNISYESYGKMLENNKGGKIFDLEDEKHLLVYQKYPAQGWTILGLVPTHEITKENTTLIKAILIVLVIAIGLLVLFIVSISASLTKPIVSLNEAMKNVAEGDLNTSAEIYYNDEIGTLATTFNHMVENTVELMDDLVEEQNQKRKYELSLMQSQLNPHFLYNTLENICGLAELNRNEDIIDLVSELAEFYRSVLSSGNMIVSVAEEIEMTQRYLNIIKTTYGERLNYSIDVNPDILHYQTVKLILQPIVENAVQHGIRHRSEGGTLTIVGDETKEYIIFTVHDDGIGMTEEDLDEVGYQMNFEKRRDSFGLSSTNERIKMYSGKQSGITITSEESKGTTVQIKLYKQSLGEE